jgi:hypothetical protein
MKILFELAIVDYDMIELRWPIAFGKARSEPYEVLATALEPVKGINRLEVLRYNAYIEVAAHVENLGSVLESVRQHLLDDEQLAQVLGSCGVTDYGVTVAPGVVTRR